MKLCPRCRLPARAIGRAFAASSADGTRHGVIGICSRCVDGLARLPKQSRHPDFPRALERGLDDPLHYTVKILPDAEIAALAVSLLGHSGMAARTLAALDLIGTK